MLDVGGSFTPHPIKHIILGHTTLKNLTGTVTKKFVFYRDLKPKRLRTTALGGYEMLQDFFFSKHCFSDLEM